MRGKKNLKRRVAALLLATSVFIGGSLSVCAETTQVPVDGMTTAVTGYDPLGSYSFQNEVLAAARANWLGKKTLRCSRVSAIDNIPALFDNSGNQRTWLEWTSTKATVPKGSASATDYHEWGGKNGTKLDYNTMFGVNYKKYKNAFDLMMGELVTAGIDPNFDAYTMTVTQINDFTLRYQFESTADQPAYVVVKAKVSDIASITKQSVRITVDYDIRYGTYQFSFVDVTVQYKTANCPSGYENDRTVYTSYAYGAR